MSQIRMKMDRVHTQKKQTPSIMPNKSTILFNTAQV